MKDFEIAQGATRPNLTRRLSDDASVIDDYYSVKLVMESVDGVTVERTAEVSDIRKAEVTVDWQRGDTDVKRSYRSKFVVKYKDGNIAKFPKSEKFIVTVK